ncbi:MAG: ATP-binding protein, partial [Alphaproteobacteria bacterium]|nr:ATP-binding protein [Alphaproteobacteria bacterium]
MTFRTKTNWIAITGTTSAGKTTVINELAKRGHSVLDEGARQVLSGIPLEEIVKNRAALQIDILKAKIENESALGPSATIFLDRAIPDSITYYRINNLDIAPSVEASHLFQYRAILIFDPLPYVPDDIRTEDEEMVKRLDRELEEDYRSLGYNPIRVPVMSVEERVAFILEKSG